MANNVGGHIYPSVPPEMQTPNPYMPYDPNKEAAPPQVPAQFPPPPYHPTAYVMQPPPGPQYIHPTTVIVGPISFGENPQSMTCPSCQNQIVTGTRPKAGLLAWLICGGLTLFACWICCCIPFCIDRCQDVEHYCPKCNRLIGIYRRI